MNSARSFRRLFLLVTFLLPVCLSAQPIRVATFNIKFDTPNDGVNQWSNRSAVVANLIRFHGFDIFGTQEGLKNQLDDIITALPEYARFGGGRNDGKDAGEHSALFFRKDRFKLLGGGNFWLSETPEKPGLGWDATCCNRICSWARLRDLKSKKTFYVFNVHFDHQGMVARVESGKLMLRKIGEIAGSAPVILTGDFNGSRATEWYRAIAGSSLVHDTWGDAGHPYANNGSFNNWGKDVGSDDVIDHIFASKHFVASSWGILTDTYHGKYPSDHFPVLAELSFRR